MGACLAVGALDCQSKRKQKSSKKSGRVVSRGHGPTQKSGKKSAAEIFSGFFSRRAAVLSRGDADGARRRAVAAGHQPDHLSVLTAWLAGGACLCFTLLEQAPPH